MSCTRALVCLLLPPLAVIDKGCGAILVTTVLWIAGWIPGVIAAAIFCTRAEPSPPGEIRVKAVRSTTRPVDDPS